MIKWINPIAFVIAVILLVVTQTPSKISSALYSVLPQTKEKELLKEFLTFDTNKQLFIAIKGFDKNSLKELQKFEKALSDSSFAVEQQLVPSKELQAFQKEYYFYLNELQKTPKSINTSTELSELYHRIATSFITPSINPQDPFGLVQPKTSSINIKNGKLVLNNYGYLSLFNINNATTLQEYEKIYDFVKNLEKQYPNIQTFSSIYYFVENSRIIKKDATFIVTLATVFLLLMYGAILKNIKLLTHTLLTLSSAGIFSTIVLSSFYQELSLFVLVFGFSVSTIAIDYMFHHYFHKEYEKQKRFNKAVFLGFFTTAGAFVILSFTPFLLIKQIAWFTVLSLSYSYIMFSFAYTRMHFKQNNINIKIPSITTISSKLIVLSSLIVIGISLLFFKFDFNIKSLDITNTALQNSEQFFKSKLQNKPFDTIIIEAKTIDELISYNEQIKAIDKDSKSGLNQLFSQKRFYEKQVSLSPEAFNKLQQEIQKNASHFGFTQDAFKQAYQLPQKPLLLDYEDIKAFNIPILKFNQKYITFIQVSKSKSDEISQLDFAYNISLKSLFEQSLKESLNTLMLLGAVIIGFILLIITVVAKKKTIKALSFLLFPTACIALYFTQIPINILHLFMYFIIVAIGIDYAIYMVHQNNQATYKAIVFSALSSFTGFGVLFFSSTLALFSIGSVASIGIVAIILLIFLQGTKRDIKCS